MKWKNKLKTVLAETADTKIFGICLEKVLTKTDKTQIDIVSSVFVSGQLRDFPENSQNIGNLPKCSNCKLEMNLIENGKIWFCSLGCESRKVIQ